MKKKKSAPSGTEIIIDFGNARERYVMTKPCRALESADKTNQYNTIPGASLRGV
jgi:hypothetical protein